MQKNLADWKSRCTFAACLMINIKETKMKDEKIFVKRSEVKRLADIFKVSEVMVYMALRYDRDSELARKIRHTALKSKADGGCGGEVWKRIK